MSYLRITGSEGAGKTTSAILTIAHFVREHLNEIRGNEQAAQPKVLLVSRSDHQARVLRRYFLGRAESFGYCEGEAHGTVIVHTLAATAQRMEVADNVRGYDFVLIDGLARMAVATWVGLNRGSMRPGCCIVETEGS